MYTDFLSTIIYNSSTWDSQFSLIEVNQNETHNISLVFKPSTNILVKTTVSAEETRLYYPEFQNPSFFESDYLEAINFYKDVGALPNEDISEVSTVDYYSIEFSSSNCKYPLLSSSPFII